MFLDEPTSGVDPIARRQFWELIYEAAARKTTVFITTHYMDEAEYCDRTSIMTSGRIAAMGTPADLKEQFDHNVRVLPTDGAVVAELQHRIEELLPAV